MKIALTLLGSLLLALPASQPACAEDSLRDWKYSGKLAILTTKDGANLPTSACVVDFPVLVRLSKETFDFRQAQPGGEDVRFSAEGKLLAYPIETWDAIHGSAVIWVRVPVIKGNQRQLITMHCPSKSPEWYQPTTLSDCEPLLGDKVWSPARWKGQDLSSLKGKRLQMRFRLTKAKVFGFKTVSHSGK